MEAGRHRLSNRSSGQYTSSGTAITTAHSSHGRARRTAGSTAKPEQTRKRRESFLTGLPTDRTCVGFDFVERCRELSKLGIEIEVKGLEAVANDEEGRELWRLGALRALLTSALAALQ